MSFAQSGLKMIAAGGQVGTGPGNVNSVYHYVTNDTAATVEGDGYFDGIEGDPLVAGDVIHASLDIDGTPAFKSYVVSVGGGDVTIQPAANLTFAAAYTLVVDIADLSAEAAYYVVAPIAGTIRKIYSAIDGAVSTADVTITASIGGVDVTNGVVTIATAGSAAGDVDVATPSAANALTAGQALKLLVSGGGSGGSPKGHVTVLIDPS